MRTEKRRRENVAIEPVRIQGDPVSRTKLPLLPFAGFLLLATLACEPSSPSVTAPGAGRASTLFHRVTQGLSSLRKDDVSLRIDMPPAVPPGRAFRVEVSYRNSSGQLLDISEKVSLELAKNPAKVRLSGTLTRSAVNGVAVFSDLSIDTLGEGYTIVAKAPRAADVTSAPFAVAFSVVAPPQPPAPPAAPPSDAPQISPDVPLFATLTPGHVDYYAFHGQVGDIVTVSSFANRLDMENWDTSLRIRLIAPDGTTEIARSAAPSLDARAIDNGFSMVRLPQEGDYFLACDLDQEGFLSGAYALLLETTPNPGALLQKENEAWGVTGDNDSPATAQPLSPGLLYGHFDTPQANTTASDFYKIAIATPSHVRIDLTAARNGAAYGDVLWNPRLELQDAAGAVLWSNDDSYGLDPVIDYVVVKPGTYYVRVTRSESPSNTGASPYFLSYLRLPYLPLAQPAGNTSAAAAMAILPGVDVSGSFTVAGDRYFAFPGTAGELIRLTALDRTQLQSASLTMNPKAGADAVLLGPDGVTPLPASAAFATSAESKLDVRQTILQSSGTHFVRVRSTTAGTFGLRVDRLATTEREAEPNGTTAQANRIGPSGWISGAIGAAGDEDHFLVHAAAGQLVTVSLVAAAGAGMGTAWTDWGSALMPKVEVRAAGAVVSAAGADRKGSLNFAESAQPPSLLAPMVQTAFRATAAGDYEIVVTDADGQGGPTYFYALQVAGNR